MHEVIIPELRPPVEGGDSFVVSIGAIKQTLYAPDAETGELLFKKNVVGHALNSLLRLHYWIEQPEIYAGRRVPWLISEPSLHPQPLFQPRPGGERWRAGDEDRVNVDSLAYVLMVADANLKPIKYDGSKEQRLKRLLGDDATLNKLKMWRWVAGAVQGPLPEPQHS